MRTKFLAVKLLMSLYVVLFSGTLLLSGNNLVYARAYQHFAKSTHGASSQGTRMFWVQVMDSCRQALPGAYFVYRLSGASTNIHAGPTPGQKPVTIAPTPTCPLERGDCVDFTTGCLAFNIPIPAFKSMTYTIKEMKSPRGYTPCTGGSVCPGGPQVITLHINASGVISATVFNVYPDQTTVTWPTSGVSYRGTPSDPAVLHNFGIGNGSCDGDHDADDHLTGSPSIHCDSDND